MDNINGNITMAEAKKLIETVSFLAKNLTFTRLESMKIAKVCEDCLDRLIKEADTE